MPVRAALVLGCLALLGAGTAPLLAAPVAPTVDQGPATAERWIIAFHASQEEDARAVGAEIWDRGDKAIIAGASTEVVSALRGHGIDLFVQVPDEGQYVYALSHEESFQLPQTPLGAAAYPISASEMLYLFPGDCDVTLPAVRPLAAFRGVPRQALPAIEAHALDKAAAASLAAGKAPAPLTVNPLVTQIVNNTSQANWLQYEKDVSGENPVIIGGVSRTISTRYSYAMFPSPLTNAMASEYLLEKAAGWGYTGVRESYTQANSGCSQGGNTWQNLIFTLPGQIDYGAHAQVFFVTHYDSLSQNPNVYAPGADDAMSGGSALIEALRLFKDYAWNHTVKIIFFSGEEQGLCGSIAYTHQHPSADMYRAVNMDQTAYDGDQNLWMDCYNWDSTNSPQSVALGDAFVQANTDYGPIITPANIFRPTNKMCQTDHCPFWNVGVGAIAVTEDLMHNDICPCFDNTDSSTCHDSLTQIDPNHAGRLMFTQNYSWPSEKNAIATVAAVAEPLYACPPSAPTPTLTPGNNVMHVNWPTAPGVTNYVLERAASCAGPFTAITSVPGTTFDDVNVTNGTTYAYRVRTCPLQAGACLTSAPQAGPSVIYQAGSAAVTADSGDHDNIADNCELVTATVNLYNDGNTPLTNVKLTSLTSPNANVQIVTQIPQNVGSLGVGASAPVAFKFYLGRSGSPAACGDVIPFTVSASSDQAPLSTRTFSLTAEQTSASGSFTYGFESGMDGWTVTTGSFTRVVGGAPASMLFSLHSRNANSICDAIASPILTPTGSSTMTMWVNYSIEGNGSTTNIYDRAVVRAVNTLTGVKMLLVPTGAPYTTTGDNATLCDGIDQLSGYAGSLTTWTQATFNLSAFAGIPIQIEVRFATDSSVTGTEGFWFDLVNVTNASQTSCDAQSNSCAALPAEVSETGNPVEFTIDKSGGSYALRFSEVSGATQYEIYAGDIAPLRSGVYNHAASGGVCALTDATPGDGQVLATLPASSFPDNSYLLAVARNAAGESVYGSATSGATIPLALSACP